MSLSPVDNELLRYFALLSNGQKKALLELIKAFFSRHGLPGAEIKEHLQHQQLMETPETIYKTHPDLEEESQKKIQAWGEKEYEAEMVKRFTEMENGKVKGYTLSELETKARKSYGTRNRKGK
ncbi:MAG: hypothetical protein Q8939_14690 [Bacteroidota bacterium]|nr:hypothetical protein [Bacteroidota bacterium]